jgi:hypothetical protein
VIVSHNARLSPRPCGLRLGYRPKNDPEPEIRKGELPWVIFCTLPPPKPLTQWYAWPIQRKANKREIELRRKIEALRGVSQKCEHAHGSRFSLVAAARCLIETGWMRRIRFRACFSISHMGPHRPSRQPHHSRRVQRKPRRSGRDCRPAPAPRCGPRRTPKRRYRLGGVDQPDAVATSVPVANRMASAAIGVRARTAVSPRFRAELICRTWLRDRR